MKLINGFLLSFLIIGCTDTNLDQASKEKVNEFFNCGGVGDSCYDNTAAKNNGFAITPSGKKIEYVEAANNFFVWKEFEGNKVLHANGLDDWQLEVNANGKDFSGNYYTDYLSLEGRVCPSKVYISDSNKFSINNCMYYAEFSNTTQSLDADGDDQILGLGNMGSNYGGSGSKWMLGNVLKCGQNGMRLPVLYETTGYYIGIGTAGYVPLIDGDPDAGTAVDGSLGIPPSTSVTWTATGIYAGGGESGNLYWGYRNNWRNYASYSDTRYIVCALPSN